MWSQNENFNNSQYRGLGYELQRGQLPQLYG